MDTKLGPNLVNRRLQIYWERDDEWYSGRIVSYDSEKRTPTHRVLHDDGLWHDYQLARERIQWLGKRDKLLPSDRVSWVKIPGLPYWPCWCYTTFKHVPISTPQVTELKRTQVIAVFLADFKYRVVPKKGQLKMEAISAEEALRSCQGKGKLKQMMQVALEQMATPEREIEALIRKTFEGRRKRKGQGAVEEQEAEEEEEEEQEEEEEGNNNEEEDDEAAEAAAAEEDEEDEDVEVGGEEEDDGNQEEGEEEEAMVEAEDEDEEGEEEEEEEENEEQQQAEEEEQDDDEEEEQVEAEEDDEEGSEEDEEEDEEEEEAPVLRATGRDGSTAATARSTGSAARGYVPVKIEPGVSTPTPPRAAMGGGMGGIVIKKEHRASRVEATGGGLRGRNKKRKQAVMATVRAGFSSTSSTSSASSISSTSSASSSGGGGRKEKRASVTKQSTIPVAVGKKRAGSGGQDKPTKRQQQVGVIDLSVDADDDAEMGEEEEAEEGAAAAGGGSADMEQQPPQQPQEDARPPEEVVIESLKSAVFERLRGLQQAQEKQACLRLATLLNKPTPKLRNRIRSFMCTPHAKFEAHDREACSAAIDLLLWLEESDPSTAE